MRVAAVDLFSVHTIANTRVVLKVRELLRLLAMVRLFVIVGDCLRLVVRLIARDAVIVNESYKTKITSHGTMTHKTNNTLNFHLTFFGVMCVL